MAEQKNTTQVVVLGSGPGGYTAAFRAADLGLQVTLIEQYPALGGVCLNVGCIPSKALLHIAKVLEEVAYFKDKGIQFGAPAIDLKKLCAWKEGVVKQLSTGLTALAKKRRITVIQGVGQLVDAHHLQVQGENHCTSIEFEHAIIAAGSSSITFPWIPRDPRIFSSTGALQLAKADGSLLVIGGGIIGLEMATVYHSLGCQVSIVELTGQLMPGTDPDLVKPLAQRQPYKQTMLHTKVTKIEPKKDGLWVSFEGEHAPGKKQCFDQILVAVGRAPNGYRIGAAQAGIQVDERGFIPVDNQMRTNVSHIFAVGDVAGPPMLAHKAIPEGKVAAEVIAGKKHYFDPLCVPCVAYTDPEVAWVGLDEQTAKAKQVPYRKGVFPWAANGRSLTHGRSEGLTKILFDPQTNKVLGAGIVGSQAGDLIAELALAIEMGCVAEDLALTIHPHPTLTETIAQAAEAFEGTITDLYLPR